MSFSANIKAAETCNDIILPLDIRDVVKESIAHVEQDLDELEEEIARLYAIQRSKLLKLEELYTAISPQRRLPPEVLHLVFEYAHLLQAPERKFLSCPHDLKPNVSPWNLRQVCSHWRRMALSCHSLWHAVSVEWRDIVTSLQMADLQSGYGPELPPSYDCWNRRLMNARKILPTSGNVHIHVSTTATDWEDADVLRNAFVTLVEPFLGRLETLSYECPESSIPLFHELHQIPFDQIGPLESIALRFPKKCPADRSLVPSTSLELGGLAQLRHLHISGDDEWLPFLLRHRFPWDNLITLKVLFTGYYKEASKEMALLLPRCGNLEHLEVESGRYTTGNAVNPCQDRIRLPRLKTLKITSYSPDMLKSITTPSLVSLVLACHIFPIVKVMEFLGDSKCQLQAFKEEQPYTSRATDDIHQTQCFRMLEFMETVKFFETSIAFNGDEVTPIADGQLLPNAEQLRFATREPLRVLKIMNSGFKAASAGIRVRGVALDILVEIDERKEREMRALASDLKGQYGVVVAIEFHLGKDRHSHRHLLEP